MAANEKLAARGVAQLAARHVRDVEVGSSSLLTPTFIELIAYKSYICRQFLKINGTKTGQAVIVSMLNGALFSQPKLLNNVKKMCPKPTAAQRKGSAEPQKNTISGIASALQYTPPVHRETESCSYIEFYAYDPVQGKLRRKRIKINHIKGVGKRRQYAREVIKRLGYKLSCGWNPWIAKDTTDHFLFEDALGRYEMHTEKMLANGYFRKETYAGYKSYAKILRKYIKEKHPLYYVYQFDRAFCVSFLDYVFIDRNNGAQTRNNYLNFLRVFSGFLVDKGYLKSKPTDGISPISKRLYKKERTCVPLDVVSRIANYCKAHERHFLLACYLLYYGFIRPVEMSRLKVRDFNVKAGTVTIRAECSKNKKKQTVTLPKKVILYAIELGIFSRAMDDYVFSYNLRPGPVEIDPKHFRDHWDNLRKPLGLNKEWKFYSLKDTGITAMLKAKFPAIEVRDQARHSSLAITEIYTDHSEDVNPDIFNLDGAL